MEEYFKILNYYDKFKKSIKDYNNFNIHELIFYNLVKFFNLSKTALLLEDIKNSKCFYLKDSKGFDVTTKEKMKILPDFYKNNLANSEYVLYKENIKDLEELFSTNDIKDLEYCLIYKIVFQDDLIGFLIICESKLFVNTNEFLFCLYFVIKDAAKLIFENRNKYLSDKIEAIYYNIQDFTLYFQNNLNNYNLITINKDYFLNNFNNLTEEKEIDIFKIISQILRKEGLISKSDDNIIIALSKNINPDLFIMLLINILNKLFNLDIKNINYHFYNDNKLIIELLLNKEV